MKHLLLIAAAILLTSCGQTFSVENGDFSQDGRILNPGLLKYAENFQGTYHGKYVDAKGTYRKNEAFFVSKFDRYASVLKISMNGNKPQVEIILKNDVMPVCSVEFVNIQSLSVEQSSLISYWTYKSSCDEKEHKARLKVNVNDQGVVQSVTAHTTFGAKHKTILFVQE